MKSQPNILKMILMKLLIVLLAVLIYMLCAPIIIGGILLLSFAVICFIGAREVWRLLGIPIQYSLIRLKHRRQLRQLQAQREQGERWW